VHLLDGAVDRRAQVCSSARRAAMASASSAARDRSRALESSPMALERISALVDAIFWSRPAMAASNEGDLGLGDAKLGAGLDQKLLALEPRNDGCVAEFAGAGTDVSALGDHRQRLLDLGRGLP
jgi:hypothetical protein